MEDNLNKKGEDMINSIQSFMDGMNIMLDGVAKDLTPEQRELIEKEKAKLNTDGFKKELDDVMKNYLGGLSNLG